MFLRGGRQAVGIGDDADVSREGRAHLALAARQRIALRRQRSLAQISTGIVPLPEMSLHAPVVLVTATLPMDQPAPTGQLVVRIGGLWLVAGSSEDYPVCSARGQRLARAIRGQEWNDTLADSTT